MDCHRRFSETKGIRSYIVCITQWNTLFGCFLQHKTQKTSGDLVGSYFYALNMDKALEHVSSSCHTCASLNKTPHSLVKQCSEDAPEIVYVSFAADIMKHNRQLVLLLRETATSYTATCLLQDEWRDSLRTGLLCLILEVC